MSVPPPSSKRFPQWGASDPHGEENNAGGTPLSNPFELTDLDEQTQLETEPQMPSQPSFPTLEAYEMFSKPREIPNRYAQRIGLILGISVCVFSVLGIFIFGIPALFTSYGSYDDYYRYYGDYPFSTVQRTVTNSHELAVEVRSKTPVIINFSSDELELQTQHKGVWKWENTVQGFTNVYVEASVFPGPVTDQTLECNIFVDGALATKSSIKVTSTQRSVDCTIRTEP